MKVVKIAGLCLASMLVVSMALSGTAAAAPLWLVCLEGTNLTKYSSNQCTKAEGAGKWQSQDIPAGKTVTITLVGFSLRLRDPGATGGSAAIKCNGTGSEIRGVLEPSNRAKITEIKVSNPKTNCERLEGGCKAGEIESIEGGHLPWTTSLVEESEKFLVHLEKGTGGTVAWTLKCNTLLGSQTDTCSTPSEAADEHLVVENQVSGGVLLVKGRFAERSRANCTQGGSERGEVSGSVAVLSTNGNGLSIHKT